MSLKRKTIKGLFWSSLAQGWRQFSQVIILAILARLLTPEDFGLLAMATVFTEFSKFFGEMGIGYALIQKQDIRDEHYNSAFWLIFFIGFFLAWVLILGSKYISYFYKEPRLRLILQVISINFILGSIITVHQAILVRKMEFKKLAIRDITATVISGISGIFLAFIGYGVWSLVYQLLIFNVLNIVLLWKFVQWRPQLRFSIIHIKDIFNFTANLTGFNIINYFSRNIDKLLIGKLLGSEALGLYSLAYKLMLYPLQNISAVIGKVLFPAFSKIQNKLEKVRKAYLKMTEAISLITFPMMVALFAMAPEFINIFLGTRWVAMTTVLRIFCICGIFQAIAKNTGTIYLSQGRPDIQFKLQFLGTTIVTLSVLIGLRWGVNGVALFYTLQTVFWAHLNFYIVNKLIHLSNRVFYSRLITPFCGALLILVYIFSLKKFILLSPTFFLGFVFLSVCVIYFIFLLISKEITIKNNKLIVSLLDG